MKASEKKLKVYQTKCTLLNYFNHTKTQLQWLIIKYLPVLPPHLRPIVKLKDKSIIVTDLNILYANIINSNNKITKFRKMSIPEKFLNSEKYLLQVKVDKLMIQQNTNKKSNLKKRIKPIINKLNFKELT